MENYTIIKSALRSGNISTMLANVDIFKDYSYKMSSNIGFNAHIAPKFGYPCPADFPYVWGYEEVREINNSKLPKLLLISDSFGENIFPFISENFSKSVKIFDNWKYDINVEIFEKENPDVVLLLMTESSLRNLVKFRK